MDISSIAVGGGPIPSFIVLEQHDLPEGEKKSRRLPIRIGTVEASAISLGIEPKEGSRPMTHDLLKATVEALGAELMSVRITGVRGTTFYAQLVLRDAEGREVCVDARPSDAIALAVRCGVRILADDSVIDAATLPDFDGVEKAEKQAELEEFHNFVEHLSPDDFK